MRMLIQGGLNLCALLRISPQPGHRAPMKLPIYSRKGRGRLGPNWVDKAEKRLVTLARSADSSLISNKTTMADVAVRRCTNVDCRKWKFNPPLVEAWCCLGQALKCTCLQGLGFSMCRSGMRISVRCRRGWFARSGSAVARKRASHSERRT